MIETPRRTLEQKHVPGHRTARTLYWKADVELRAAKLTAFVGVANLLHDLAPVGPSIVALVRPGILLRLSPAAERGRDASLHDPNYLTALWPGHIMP